MNRAAVRPVRHELRSELLQARVLATFAYRAECQGCDWRGPYRPRHAAARADARTHNRETHG